MASTPYRLTYLIDGLNVGGAQMGMVRLLSELDESNFDIKIIGLNGMGEKINTYLPDHIDIIDLNINKKYNVMEVKPVLRILKKTDILVTSLFHSVVLGTFLGKLQSIPCILCWQHASSYPSTTRYVLSKAAFKVCDMILADSKSAGSMLKDQGIPESKISVVPIAGINIEKYQPSPRSRTIEKPIQVGSIGRLVPAKNYEILIECAGFLQDEFEFHVVGDGPDRDRLEKLSSNNHNVTFHGEIPPDEVPSFLNTLDIYFQPSEREGLCITVIEAMACGLPIVGSTAGGISESVKHGQNGLLGPPDDTEMYCRYLQQLSENEILWKEFSERSRNRAIQKYSAKSLHKGFLQAINKSCIE